MSNWKVVKPRAGKNLITNPSFKNKVTTGWVAGSSGAIAISTTVNGTFGKYAMKCTGTTSSTKASYSITFPTAGIYFLSAWVYVDADFDGGDVYITGDSLASGTEEIIRQWDSGTDPTGTWYLIVTKYTVDSGDLAGNIIIRSDSVPTSGNDELTVDGVMVQADYLSTFLDGDQEGCRWLGAVGLSQSARPEWTRKGGQLIDLKDDLGMSVQITAGASMPKTKVLSKNRVMNAGSVHQRTRATGSRLLFNAVIVGSTLLDYHSKKNAITSNFGPWFVDEEPILIQYWGNGASIRQSSFQYISGLEGSKRVGFDEQVKIVLEGQEAYWHEPNWNIVTLDPESEPGVTDMMGRDHHGDLWEMMPEESGGNLTNITDFADDGEYVYITGSFLNFDGDASADTIVRFDKVAGTYSPMSTGLPTGTLTKKKLIIAPNGDLIAVGEAYVKRWDGSSWSDVGTITGGTLVTVNDVAIDFEGNIWVVGDFTSFGGVSNADYVSYYDGSAWNAAGTGLEDIANAVYLDKTTGYVWVGGQFADAGGVSDTAYISYWDGTAWKAVGTNEISGTTINDIIIDEDGTVYATGTTTNWGGVVANRIAKFTGSNWIPLGSGLNNTGHRLAIWRGNVIVSGLFTEAGGLELTNKVAMWNGSAWVHMDFDTVGLSATTIALASGVHGELYISGESITNSNVYASGKTSVSNPGNVKAHPILEVDWYLPNSSSGTEARLLSLVNEATEASVWFDYKLQEGESIKVDMRPGHQEITSTQFGKIWPVLPSSNFNSFFIQPGEANDSIITLFVLTQGEDDLVEATLSWQNTYFGID